MDGSGEEKERGSKAGGRKWGREERRERGRADKGRREGRRGLAKEERVGPSNEAEG